ncbi:DUF885 domain-containing protein [Sphingomonas sinipercae]|uniref:DUF885 domain-containing protein n=1 Tax=Sphingomonas sinipercae TaxID=2714944 RepID=UPI0019D04BA8|nr:DUF885 domain-containing protein [Sphingomonas sinipercae]
MRLIISTLLLATAGCTQVAVPVAPVPPVAVVPADSESVRFAAFSDRVVDDWLRMDPVNATQQGDHRYDALMPDVSAAGRARAQAFAVSTLAELARFDVAGLTREQQVDAILLRDQLNYALFSDARLQEWAWNPLGYSGTAGNALYTLSAREFAPLPDRLRSAIGRMEALPAFLAQARSALVPARVPLIYAQTAAKQNPGLNGLIDGFVAQKAVLADADRARIEQAAASAKAAVAEHQRWLDTMLVPNAKGDERIGAEFYDEKLRLALNSPLSRQEIRARAERTFKDLRQKMYDVSVQLLRGRAGAPPLPKAPTAAEQQRVIEAALAIVTAERPARDQVVPFGQATLEQATVFAKAKDLVGFPDARFGVIEMPEYARGYAVAYADMPGPLEPDQRGYYAVMPIPADWTAEQSTSFLREYNKWTMHELTIHEGVPGHLLQLSHANQFKSRLRALLQSGPMIEGWACYSQDVMADAGYLDRDPRYLLAHYKFQLRLPINAMLDQDFHVNGLTRNAAMTLMTQGGFQEEREAAGKWVRMQISSAQLPTYFVGYQEWLDLRAAAERRPGFSLRTFHDEALSHGSPPVRFIRQLMFGEPIQ